MAAMAFGLLVLLSWTVGSVEVGVLSEPKEAAPGEFVTHVFSVYNDSSDPMTYELEFSAPQGWGVLGAPSSISVQPAEEGTLFVTTTLPAGVMAGEYDLTVTAVSQSNPADQGTASGVVRVAAAAEVEIIAPTGVSIAPGDTLTYEFVLVNRGNVQESLTLDASSSRNLVTSLTPIAANLAPQERIPFTVTLTAPAGSDPGRDVLTVTAVSALHDAVETDAVVFTSILPPAPDAVVGTVMEELPARIRLSLDKDVITGTFDSQLTFSTSGQILGGYFSSYFSLLDPLGPDAAEISSFSMLYRREPATFTIGSVSQRLTDLLRMSCTGGSLALDGEYYNLKIIGGGTEDEVRFAGALTLGPEAVNAGVGYMGIRDATTESQAVWSATAHAEPLEDWSLQLEGALGLDGPLTSRALFFNTTIDSAGYFFSGSAFSVGTHFPGQRADSAGIEVSQRLRLSALSLSSSLSHEWDNVIRDPLQPTSIQDDLGFNLTATPLEDGPTLAATLDFTWDRYADTTLKDDISSLLSVSLTETDGVLPYSLSGTTLEQIDRVSGSHVRTTTYDEGIGLSIDSFDLYFQLSQERSVDVTTDTELASSSDVSIRFRPESALHEASITLRNDRDDFDLSGAFFIQWTDDFDITFDGSISWDRNDASDITFGWGITFSANVALPLPFLVTKGRIEGRAFVDRDGDGHYGLNDDPAPSLVVNADGASVSTDSDGYFRFPPLYPDEYAVSADQLPIDAAPGPPVLVNVIAGETRWVELPLLPVTVVRGVVFDDIDRSGTRDDNEGGYSQVRVLLESAIDGSRYDGYTDTTGAFAITDILPGTYTISVDETTLPDRFEFTSAPTYTVTVGALAPAPIAFGGFIREREVVITFQPPTADFFYEPDAPSAGQPVTFDGTYSFDFDGTIVSYAWDLDDDGVIDSTDAVTMFTFQNPGEHDVTLTVTDDAGNEDTVTYAVPVSGTSAPAADTSSVLLPLADFSYSPAQPRVGEAVTFDATSTTDPDGTIDAYEWDFNADGQTDAHGSIVEHAFEMSGDQAVTLTVRDNGGNTDSLTLTVVVAGGSASTGPAVSSAQPPIADFQVLSSPPTAGESISFNGTSSLDLDGEVRAFAWDFNGDGITDSTAPIAEHVFAEPGTYVVKLTVTDDEGNSDSIEKDVTIEGAVSPAAGPVADFAYMPSSPEPGDLILFNATLSTAFEGRIAKYAWDFDGNGTPDSFAAIVDHAFDQTGIYTVSLTVTDESGGVATISRPVTVGAVDTPPSSETLFPPIADFEYSPQSPQTGSLVRFNGTLSEDPDGIVASYAWDFDKDGSIDSTAAVSDHAFPAGSFDVSLTVTDDSGLADTLTRTLEVSAAPVVPAASASAPPIADFEYSPETPIAGQLVLFNGLLSTDSDGDVVSYAWDFNGDGTVDATEPFVEYVFASPGTFDVSLTVTDDSGNTDSFIRAIFVDVTTAAPGTPSSSFQPPVADFSFMPSQPSAGELVLFNASFSWDFDGEIVSYSWDFNNDGTPDADTVAAEHIFPAPGTFTVSLTVIDDSGASDTLSIPIDVE